MEFDLSLNFVTTLPRVPPAVCGWWHSCSLSLVSPARRQSYCFCRWWWWRGGRGGWGCWGGCSRWRGGSRCRSCRSRWQPGSPPCWSRDIPRTHIYNTMSQFDWRNFDGETLTVEALPKTRYRSVRNHLLPFTKIFENVNYFKFDIQSGLMLPLNVFFRSSLNGFFWM